MISAVVLAGLEVYRYATEHPPGRPASSSVKAKTPMTALAPNDNCFAACERLRICADPQAGTTCAADCRSQWPQGTADCVRSATCPDVGACFTAMRGPSCEEVCQKVQGCGLLLPQENCSAICTEQWDADARQCMMETPCEEIPATCLPAAEGDPCVGYCNRLTECGLVEAGDEYSCIETCMAVDNPELRECVSRIGCDQIPAVCLSEKFDPVCLDACDRLDRCDALGDLSYEECPAVCFDSWDDALLECIISRGCGELGPVCFQQYDPACDEVCGKLVDCQLEDYYEDCIIVCTTDLTDEARACIQQNECGSIERLCFGQAPNMCEVVCQKAVDCGLDSDYQACFDSCSENYDLALIGCILNNPCEQITEQCLQQQ